MSRSRRPELGRAVALALAVAGCRHAAEPEEAAPRPRVQVVSVAARSIAARVSIAGVLAPLPGKDVKVGALVPGRVDRVFVAEGDRVKVRQPLAHVEAEPLRQQVSEAEAKQATATAALANARTKLERTERLFKDGIAARQEVDDAHAALVAAESGVREARATGGIAGVQLDRATLRSPIDGVVAAILVPAGQPVDGAATPVIEVADTRVLDLRAAVPASRSAAIHPGDRAVLQIEGAGEVQGAVEAIAPLVDTATNTVTVRVRIDNADGRLRGGQFARGALLGPAHQGLAVPRSALLPGDGGATSEVAVVGGDGAIALRDVVVAAEAGDDVEIASGIAPGDRVVTAGGYALPAGTKVEIAKE